MVDRCINLKVAIETPADLRSETRAAPQSSPVSGKRLSLLLSHDSMNVIGEDGRPALFDQSTLHKLHRDLKSHQEPSILLYSTLQGTPGARVGLQSTVSNSYVFLDSLSANVFFFPPCSHPSLSFNKGLVAAG